MDIMSCNAFVKLIDIGSKIERYQSDEKNLDEDIVSDINEQLKRAWHIS